MFWDWKFNILPLKRGIKHSYNRNGSKQFKTGPVAFLDIFNLPELLQVAVWAEFILGADESKATQMLQGRPFIGSLTNTQVQHV